MKMRKLHPIAVSAPAFLVLVALGLSLLSLPAVAVPVRSYRLAHPKGRSTSRLSGKTASHTSARRAATHPRVKPTRKFTARAATSPKIRAHVRPALRAGGHVRRHQQTWPSLLQTVRLAMPPPLRGSRESLIHQNEMAEADGLERILDDADLNDRIAHGSLVPVPVSSGLRINTDLPDNRRYCRPWTAKFLSDLSSAHSRQFTGAAVEVTSAVRTVEYQRRLRHINGNAAAADGDIASPHLTGGTIDIAKKGLTAREIGWLRAWLTPLQQRGKIDVEEEFRQACFHISVYKNYADPKASPLDPGAMLAARVR